MRAQLRNQNVGDFDLDEVSGALTERVKTGRQSQVVDELGLVVKAFAESVLGYN